MSNKKSKKSIGTKLYIFIILTVFLVAIVVALLAYWINVNQIDRYYKQVTFDSAVTFSSFVDGDYLAELKSAAESEEFQELRDTAEETDNEELVIDYLKKKGLWSQYLTIRNNIDRYIEGMSAVKYLYIIAAGDEDALYDMFLIDDSTNPAYETGYYEEREPELRGQDFTSEVEPIISTGDWGWLCSAYAPVYDSQGNVVCQVGCDFGMDEVMAERNRSLLYIILAAVLFTIIVLVVAVIFIRKTVIKPIDGLLMEMKKFHPSKNVSYEEAGVANMDIKSRDEIYELYDGVRTMEVNIIDYLNDLDTLQKDKERAEEGIRELDEEIGHIREEVNRDTLTQVGSKAAYIKKVETLNEEIADGHTDFGVVMVDMNDLKMINDKYGHKSGDLYIQGCCRMICESFQHSPVYRIGGDEFIVILQGKDFENRYTLVANLKDNYIRTGNDQSVEPWERFSAAVGMAEHASDDRTLDLIFKRADKAMYEDKQQYKMSHGSYR